MKPIKPDALFLVGEVPVTFSIGYDPLTMHIEHEDSLLEYSKKEVDQIVEKLKEFQLYFTDNELTISSTTFYTKADGNFPIRLKMIPVGGGETDARSDVFNIREAKLLLEWLKKNV